MPVSDRSDSYSSSFSSNAALLRALALCHRYTSDFSNCPYTYTHANTQSAATTKYTAALFPAPLSVLGNDALVRMRRMLTMRPDSDVPPMSACVYISGMDATSANRDPCATASATPLSAMPTQSTPRFALKNAGTSRHTRKRQKPSRTLTPGGTRNPNLSTSMSESRFGRKYSTPNTLSTCFPGCTRSK